MWMPQIHALGRSIYTDGFAETGPDGRQRQDEIVRLARAGGVRLLGPNCSGVYSTVPRCALSVNSAIERLEITRGPLAIISQSGSMTGGLVSRGLGRGVGFSRIVSIGNEADLGVVSSSTCSSTTTKRVPYCSSSRASAMPSGCLLPHGERWLPTSP